MIGPLQIARAACRWCGDSAEVVGPPEVDGLCEPCLERARQAFATMDRTPRVRLALAWRHPGAELYPTVRELDALVAALVEAKVVAGPLAGDLEPRLRADVDFAPDPDTVVDASRAQASMAVLASNETLRRVARAVGIRRLREWREFCELAASHGGFIVESL